MGESVPQDGMGKAMSLLFIASSASGILSYIAFGSMIGRSGNSRLFALSAVFVVISVLFYFRVSETARRRAGRPFERFKEALEGVTLLKEPPLKLFMVYLCFELFVSSIASPFVPLFLRKGWFCSRSQGWICLGSPEGFLSRAGYGTFQWAGGRARVRCGLFHSQRKGWC